eukprot:maker-scaffold_1-snap-gene-28.29-mRNA-1 protein AED:0.48 eAED:0.48 QI:0/0/0/0.5/1/1/2/0/265
MFFLNNDKLNYKNSTNPHFAHPNGAGRHAFNSGILGIIFGFSLACIIFNNGYFWFNLYLVLVTFFHFSEWYMTAIYRPTELDYSSWVINQSPSYTLAMFASLMEFFIVHIALGVESSFIQHLLSSLAFVGCVLSLAIRLLAMKTAAKNFNHRIALEKPKDHELVTHGVYQYLRHPSYFGWFYWSISSQLLLGNYVCFLLFSYVGASFFTRRLGIEERALLQMYPETYRVYAEKTPIGIPYVRSAIPFEGAYKKVWFQRRVPEKSE